MAGKGADRKNKYSKSPVKQKLKVPINSAALPIHCVSNSEEEKMEIQRHVSEQDISYKCLDEVRLMLNYTPESLFLRRMKAKLESLQNQPKLISNSSAISNIENVAVRNSNNRSDISPRKHKQFLKSGDGFNCSEGRQRRRVRNRSESLSAGQRKSYHKCATGSSKSLEKMKYENKKVPFRNSHSQSPLRSGSCTKAFKVSAAVTQKKYSQKGLKTRSKMKHGSANCYCKKQIGGLCCCETQEIRLNVNGPANKGNDGEKKSLTHVFTQEISVQVPEDPRAGAESQTETEPQVVAETQTEPDAGFELDSEPTSVHQKVLTQLSNKEQERTPCNPCLGDLESLSHFRQKHWFDCHAHPHGETSLQQRKCGLEEVDFMDPLSDPCVRAYRLNSRLFAQTAWEAHGAGCCFAGFRGPVPPLPPTQRRLVTLPPVSHNHCPAADTFVHPPGVQAFPDPANLLVYDPSPPPALPLAEGRPPTTKKSSSRPLKPVPSNSLALRFQKGIGK